MPDASANKAPVVSVVIPTYNRAALLRTAMQSIQAQSFTDWEMLVVDDGSTDDTRALVKDLAAKDKRIVYYHQAHSGNPAAVHNVALEHARGTYYCKQDDDDISHPERLAQCVAYMQRHEDVALLATPEGALDAPAHEARADAPRFFRMDMLRALQGWRSFFPTNEDRDLMLRAQTAGYAQADLPERLYHHRTLADNQVTRRPVLLASLALVDFCHILRARGLPDFVMQGFHFTRSLAILKNTHACLPQTLLGLRAGAFQPGGARRAIREWRQWFAGNLRWHYQHGHPKSVGTELMKFWHSSGHLQFWLWWRLYLMLVLALTTAYVAAQARMGKS